MEIIRNISLHAGQVLPHQLLMSWLRSYKRPNDKIRGLKAKGILMPLKKGLYFPGPAVTNKIPDKLLVANQLMGPSYVSMEAAMSYYGLIPEKVYETSSMTTKASRDFETALGLFSYTHLPLPYYSFGLRALRLPSNQNVLIASKEKAVCDKIVATAGINIRSVQSAYTFLVENMRIDESALTDMDTNMIRSWIVDSPKKESLRMMIKFIENL